MKWVKMLFILGALLCRPVPALAAEPVVFYVSGGTGYVVIQNEPVIELDHAYQGMSVAQRVRLIAIRLRNIYEQGDFDPAALELYRSRKAIGISYRGQLLALADPYTAYRKRVSQERLARLWMTRLTAVADRMLRPYVTVESAVGLASWYGRKFRGRRTACGEYFDENRYTAAHRSLPFGTRIRVTNLMNNRSVVVVINDRGPWIKSRLLDLSWSAAASIGIRGVVRVKMEVLALQTATQS
ncbi:rare lipoprotein A [Hydrogenispora ethanolica]|uniref:Probable endolytic peptidoglycan transglycosylase RlpA n=1 Tax=Hydrogenispora ethanolica TaxID=1082276 RepID=A0A4R1RVX0_HYDET|nr:septal ring lytic transglycosylase RlpA family protein [Hydrogenispora ethanolica]TCL70716.1 rare lipoprotein A [Hydrogenispora ethanolica]